jgi:hypothetical protein
MTEKTIPNLQIQINVNLNVFFGHNFINSEPIEIKLISFDSQKSAL